MSIKMSLDLHKIENHIQCIIWGIKLSLTKLEKYWCWLKYHCNYIIISFGEELHIKENIQFWSKL